MGLREEFKEYKRKKEIADAIKEFFESIGITIDDLKKLKDYKPQVVITDEQKAAIKEKQVSSMTPQQMVEYFSHDMEEFYPDGKPNNQ